MYELVTNEVNPELRKVWVAGNKKAHSYSYCISIPIELARKYDIKEGDNIVFTDIGNGSILIKKLVIG